MTANEIAPLAAAAAVIIPVVKDMRKRAESMEELKKMIERNSLQILLLILHNEHLPVRERLNAGKQYIDKGGNGASAVYYKKLEARYGKLVEAKVEGDKL